jgi:hypothetical protein
MYKNPVLADYLPVRDFFCIIHNTFVPGNIFNTKHNRLFVT